MIKVFIAFVFFVIGNDEAEISVLLLIGLVDEVPEIIIISLPVRLSAISGAIPPRRRL